MSGHSDVSRWTHVGFIACIPFAYTSLPMSCLGFTLCQLSAVSDSSAASLAARHQQLQRQYQCQHLSGRVNWSDNPLQCNFSLGKHQLHHHQCIWLGISCGASLCQALCQGLCEAPQLLRAIHGFIAMSGHLKYCFLTCVATHSALMHYLLPLLLYAILP